MTLHLGPFAGEFGWELCCWNPIARRLAFDHDGPVIVEAPAGSRHLYEFADEFVPVSVEPNTSEGLGGKIVGSARVSPIGFRVRPDEREHGDPDRLAFRAEMHHADPRKIWRRLGTTIGEPLADVCVAFRPPKAYGGQVYPEKSWAPERALELVAALQAQGFRVAALGGRDNFDAGVAPDLDLRGAPLERQCDALAGARLALGPSSAPIHLASLCGTPHVTWYGRGGGQNVSSRNRYAGAWNPFRTRHAFLEHLNPTPQAVLEACRRFLT